MVRAGRGSRLPVGFGKCADVYESAGVAMAGEQYSARPIFSGAEAWAGGAGVAELECEVARAGGALPLAAADGDFSNEDEFAVPRPANGKGARASGSVGGTKYRTDAGGKSPGGEGCSGLFDVAGASRLQAAGNFGNEHRIFGGVYHAGARQSCTSWRIFSRVHLFCRRGE